MEDDNLESYSTNCLNAGYKSLGNKTIFLAKTVADRLMCTLMTGALNFLNKWRKQSGGSNKNDPTNEALKEHIRCAIVNVFMYILLASPCKSQMGINNAWYTVQQMEGGTTGGLITDGKCAQGVFQNIQIGEFDMQTKIQEWLKKNKRVTDKIGGENIQGICKKKLDELGVARQDENDMDESIELTKTEKEAISELGQALKTIVEEVKTAVMQCARENGACIDPSEHAASSQLEDNDSKATVSNSVAGGTTATEPTDKSKHTQKDSSPKAPKEHNGSKDSQEPKVTATPPQQGRADTTAGDAVPSASVSPQAEPSLPPESGASGTAGSATPTNKSGAEAQTPQATVTTNLPDTGSGQDHVTTQ
ncbi:hypothetical protein AK88_05661, partial [Plasmodium fragile]